MHVFDYLGESKNSRNALEQYQYNMQLFLTKGINHKGQSTATLIHLNYPYDATNIDSWYQFSAEMQSVLQAHTKWIDGKEIYLVSAEDIDDEEQK